MISACLAACHMAVSFHAAAKERIREKIDIWNTRLYDTHIEKTEMLEQGYSQEKLEEEPWNYVDVIVSGIQSDLSQDKLMIHIPAGKIIPSTGNCAGLHDSHL